MNGRSINAGKAETQLSFGETFWRCVRVFVSLCGTVPGIRCQHHSFEAVAVVWDVLRDFA